MADRYWVGGAGTWDATTTTNWSASSGGAGGASAPTSADNVIFDTLSNATAYAVTIGTNAVAADITIAGPAAGSVTITSSAVATSVINCYGSWTNAATGVAFSTIAAAQIQMRATTTGKTVNTNNVSSGVMTWVFSGVGGGWTLTSNYTVSGGTISITAGSWSTGNFNVTTGTISTTGTTTRSITLGTSVLTCTAAAPVTMTSVTGLTFAAGTSTITCSGTSPTFTGGGLTYSTVTFTGTATGTTTITGANTFTTLSQATVAAAGLRSVSIGADQTVSGTLTLSNGAAANRRISISSSVTGTPCTLTVATIAALVDVDFQDIVAAGASATSPWTGTRLGNCLGNTNITFDAGVNKYFRSVSGASANWNGTVWSTSSADTATPAVNDFPLAQDTAIIDDAGAIANNGLRTGNTVTISNNWNMGTLNFSGRTVAFNWTQANQDPIIYGDVTLSSSMTMTTVTGTPTWTFSGAGLTQTVDSAGITIRLNNFIVDSPGGTVSLARDTTVELTAGTAGTSSLFQGTLSLGSFTLTTVFFSSTTSTTRILAFGTGNITITGVSGTVFNGPTSSQTGLTTTGTAQVNITGNGTTTRTIRPGSASAMTGFISFTISAGSDTINSFAGQTFNSLTFTSGFTGTFSGFGGFTLNLFGNLTLDANTNLASGASTLTFNGTGSRTITTAGKTFDFPVTFNGVGGTWTMQDALTLGATQPLTFTNGALQLAAGTTSTVGSFVTSGTTLKYLQSTIPGTQATISQASGTVTATYLSIQDSNATGGATWDASAATNFDAGNNTGWSLPPFYIIIGNGITIGSGISLGTV